MSDYHPITKHCSCCHKTLAIDAFSKDKSQLNGLACVCRKCRKIRRLIPRVLAMEKWKSMLARIKNLTSYEHVEIRLTRTEFIEWITPLLEKWDPNNGIPSVDRIDPKGHYELPNMQIISHSENRMKDRINKRAKPGFKWCPKCDEYRPWSEFPKANNKTFGLYHYCRFHWNQYQRDRHKLKSV